LSNLQYCLRDYNYNNLNFGMRVTERGVKWQYWNRHGTSNQRLVELEDEIARLRSTMEQTFIEQNSLSSDLVISISCELDKKLNEYMTMSN